MGSVGRRAAWLGGGVVMAGAAAATVLMTQSDGSTPPAADPARIFTRADAAGLFAQSAQGDVAAERSTLGAYPGEWTATGGAQVEYAFLAEGAVAARSEVTQAGFLHARQLANGSIAEYGLEPVGCRLELAHGGDRISVSDSDVRGDADCGALMLTLAVTIDGRF
jgi:Ca2+-binding RTX toxin-like protein